MNNTEQPWLLPRTDVVFKNLFGKHPKILSQFLQCVLDLKPEEYKKITLIDTNQRQEPENKLSVVDLKIETVSGDLIEVEVQLALQKSLVKRILYYLSQMLVAQLQIADPYSKLKRVISVLIVDKNMFPEDNRLHHRFRFADREAGMELTNLMEVNVLELEKARQKENVASPLDVWLKFLAASTKEEFMEYAAQNSGVNDACIVLKALSADEQMRLEAENRQKAWRDEEDRLEGVREDERECIALTMLRAGEPLEKIVAYTNLSRERICGLKK